MARRLTALQAKNLGARLREERVLRGLSVALAGEACSVHHSQVSRCESGLFKFLSGNVQKLCDYLGVIVNAQGDPQPRGTEMHAQLTNLLQSSPAAAPALKAFFDLLQSVVDGDSPAR
jgi:transcriptional regulator with XRE-family HTH domain